MEMHRLKKKKKANQPTGATEAVVKIIKNQRSTWVTKIYVKFKAGGPALPTKMNAQLWGELLLGSCYAVCKKE